ncbi:MAG: hypothetical protein HY328_01835 [Chloroflexi bacterium]|nr:hypothetical protein [Chloroflexota bacterium]
MTTQTYALNSNDWLLINQGLHITLQNVFPMYFQVVGHATQRDNSYVSVLAYPIVTDDSDFQWNKLFADSRSEDVFAALANEAREADEIDLWSLEDSGL